MAKKKLINQSLIGAVYVDDGDGLVHNYDIFHNDDDKTTIVYSGNALWSEDIVGSIAGVIDDDGDNVTISIGDEEITLDYGQMDILTALIMACNNTEMELREHRTISSLKPIIR